MFEKIQPSDFRELILEQMFGFMEEILECEGESVNVILTDVRENTNTCV
ncbi:hypothetical protein SAMN05660368_01924 [Marvinbryantia formatexigens]|nr:hypothetical protein SAMN05660368_01924 [Marvinbryantia formatexigens]